jgi:hypothetical protein
MTGIKRYKDDFFNIHEDEITEVHKKIKRNQIEDH